MGIVAGESDVSVPTDRDERLLIGGEWVAGGDGGYEIVNPATEDVVGVAPALGTVKLPKMRSNIL